MIKYSELNLGQKETGLLRKITTVSVLGAEKFVAEEHLKTANIGYRGDNFDKLFLKKVEEKVEGITVEIHHLEKDSLDASILAELGNRAEISLAHLFQLIEKQSKGEEGLLITNGYVNIAYIFGTDGNRWAVSAGWDSGSGDWNVSADSVEGRLRWRAGYQVLCSFS